jgi:tRNA pseudouridine38-40 synthase
LFPGILTGLRMDRHADTRFVRLKLVIAYDGTGYSGWQVQKTGLGVQQRIEEALAKIFPTVSRVHGSSRTDTGVHALGMVAHVDVPDAEFNLPDAKVPLALNAHLPPDIRVMQATRVSAGFHARFDAAGKQYRYFIWNHPAMNPLLLHRAWHVRRPLDLAAMRRAAGGFLGRHDFKSFAGSRSYELEDTVRTVTRCDVKRSGPLITIIIEGDGFLYRMCRGMAGTLVQIGEGKHRAADVRSMLAGRNRSIAGMTAPACGLVLWKVYYRRPGSAPAKSRSQAP